MEKAPKPFVQVVIDGVDTVISDAECVYDADLYDRYATFEQARDAALCCIEDVLEEGDYSDESHKASLEAMHGILEAAQSYEELEAHPTYLRFVSNLSVAA